MNLRELSANLRSILDMATDGELNDTLEKKRERLQGQFHEKHDAIRSVLQAHKAGEALPDGVSVEARGTHLRLK
jgi:hypothetical protein